MEDFQDFLTHKCAHVVIGEFKDGKFDEAKRLYDDAVSTYTHGFKGAYLLQEQGTEKGISVIFWDSEESMKENISDAYKSVLKKIMPLFASPPTTTFYELVSEIHPKPASDEE
ncbi:MAG TPA: antibiotic biosynthesis monooxygenase [Crinalium sp.]|jgi:heme-degrading monooxygenase HmoA